MKSKEFIKEAPIDQAIAQANQPKGPGVISKAVSGAAGFAAGIGKAAMAGWDQGGGMPRAGSKSYTPGTGAQFMPKFGQQAQQGAQAQQAQEPAQANSNDVVKLLKQTARNQPIAQPTGNRDLDDLLRKAGLLR